MTSGPAQFERTLRAPGCGRRVGITEELLFVLSGGSVLYVPSRLMNSALAKRIAAIVGFLGVALGAMGSHILQSRLHSMGTAAFWQTGVLYHLVHAVALLGLCGWKAVPRWAVWFFVAGILLFSGSLYVLALTNIRWLGAITPLGGLAFLAGWIALGAPFARGNTEQNPQGS